LHSTTEEQINELFPNQVGDIKISNRKPDEVISDMLRNTAAKTQDAAVAAMDEALGIPRPKVPPIPDTRRKSIYLAPANSKDAELLEKLMNDPQYKILYYKDTFTGFGEYRAFVIYSAEAGIPEEQAEA
jgi:hypothetical protein